MNLSKRVFAGVFSLCMILSGATFAADYPVKIDPFPQKVTHKYMASKTFPLSAVISLAECGGKLFTGTSIGIASFADDKWQVAESPATEVKAMACVDGTLYAGGPNGLYAVSSGEEQKTIYSGAVSAITEYGDGILASSGSDLLLINKGTVEKIKGYNGGEINALDTAGAMAWIGAADGVYKFDGKETTKQSENAPEILAGGARDVYAAADGTVYAATGVGIAKLNSSDGTWSVITGKNGGLPYEDVISIDGRDGFLWVGTSIGAARFDGTEWQYMQGPEYIANDMVYDVLATENGQAWLATPGGPSFIEYRTMTLEEKAAYFEKIVHARHDRYGLISDSKLKDPDDLSTNYTVTRDNDGLWTSMYVAAECYRYAVTGSEEAREYARKSMESIMFLETVTELDGFMARSFAKPDDDHGTGEWNHITSDGKWRWKGDTSSDEVDGHYYVYSVYYDLCADEKEKEMIREKVTKISNHIIDNDYFLIDVDGKRTTWGLWNPDYLNAQGRFQRNLNALEILFFLKTAYHITGNEKFQEHYMKLGKDNKYFKYMVKAKLFQPGLINHSDDELAFLAYYPLLKYEKDPRILEFFHESIIRSWEIEKPEKSSLFNFIYGAVMPEGTDFDVDGAIYNLKRVSLDMVFRPHKNSHRADIEIDSTNGRHDEVQSIVPLPPDERVVMKWNGNPYRLDDGGRSEEETPTFWLLPYWMARYYGFIDG